MAKILLGVTGSVASIYTPALFQDLVSAGHQVKVVATRAAFYFFDASQIASRDGERNRDVVILDEDEWPGDRYRRGEPVLHIELRRWAEIFMIAPLDANTLAKLASGLADNCLTCVWRAWDRNRPVLLAPAMNTLMWEHPLTRRQLAQLAEDAGCDFACHPNIDILIDQINQAQVNLTIVPPISKRLACDDVGVGAMAERRELLAALARAIRDTAKRRSEPC